MRMSRAPALMTLLAAAGVVAASVAGCGDNRAALDRATGQVPDGGETPSDDAAVDGAPVFPVDAATNRDAPIAVGDAAGQDGTTVDVARADALSDGDPANDAPAADAPLGDAAMPEPDPCAPNPCLNGGQCGASGGLAACLCPPGYSGPLCEVAPDPCGTNNGGCDPLVTCTNDGLVPRCGACPKGYRGSGVTGCTDIDECATNTAGCAATATCANTVGGFVCTCRAPLLGDGFECHTLPAAGALAAGNYHTCARGAGGAARCWGADWRGQASTSPGGAFEQVTAGADFACGLRADHTVACWGDHWAGQDRPPAEPLYGIAAGADHVCGLSARLAAVCWGDDESGQGTPPAGAVFLRLSGGYAHTCGVRGNSAVTCWGENASGQSRAPSGTFTQVSAGMDHTCAVRTSGAVVCWGANGFRQTTVPSGTFTQVAAGGRHTCALRASGTVACWGDDRAGQASPPSGTFVELAAGFAHTCARAASGTITCWGDDENGESTP